MNIGVALWMGPKEQPVEVKLRYCSGYWVDENGVHLRTAEGIEDHAPGTYDGVMVCDRTEVPENRLHLG